MTTGEMSNLRQYTTNMPSSVLLYSYVLSYKQRCTIIDNVIIIHTDPLL